MRQQTVRIYFTVDLAALEDDVGRLDAPGPAFVVARDNQLFAEIKTIFREFELVGRQFLQRIEEEPFDKGI
jgi:hypothetical protein